MPKFTDNDIMPFGIHKGKKMANVPPEYLIWIFDNNKCYGGVLWYIRDNYDTLQQEIELKKKSR